MQPVRLLHPRADLRRCSSQWLIASVGLLEVHGPVEVGQHVRRAFFQGPPEADEFVEHGGNS